MTIDYERYARERPIFSGDYEYPSLFVDVVRERRGTYADLGAGDGGQIKSAVDQGLLRCFDRIIAVDISASRIARVASLLPDVEAVVADAQALPLADRSVDVVYSSQVIEHVPDDAAMAREIHRILRPGGAAVIGSAMRLPGAWYFYRYRGRWVLDPTHVREYASVEQYSRVFSDAGLSVLRTQIEPIRYAVSDMLLGALIRLRLSSARAAAGVYESSAFWRRARGWRLAVPRYRHVFALLQRPIEGDAAAR